MKRKDFIKLAGVSALSVPVISTLMNLENITNAFKNTKRMPVLFLGHGSPMNAIEDNEFVREFKKQGKQLDKPNAIIVVSAHWETNGTFVTAMERPKTIHDFGGFPEELYKIQYPAPGHPELAKELTELVTPESTVHLDDKWGLDHGSWSVVQHMFPDADVPVIQLSIDRSKPPAYHYQLASQLSKLRDKGVLIIGSGNMVHNLRKVAWDKINEHYAHDWALEADQKMKTFITNGDHNRLINFRDQGKAFDLAIPTPEHFIPLLYTLGLKDKKEDVQLFNDRPLGGAITMTSVKIG